MFVFQVACVALCQLYCGFAVEIKIRLFRVAVMMVLLAITPCCFLGSVLMVLSVSPLNILSLHVLLAENFKGGL